MPASIRPRNRAVVLVVGALLVLAAATRPARSQDSHYWDSQYGTAAELLGGLVVGAPTDLSATFYNPGWLALHEGNSVLMTTKAVEGYRIEIENAYGTRTDPATTTFGASPGYLAGRFHLDRDWGWSWAYTYLERVRFGYDAGGAIVVSDPTPPPDGDRWDALETYRSADVSESWYGVSFSRRLGDRLALGFSPFLAQRSQRSRLQISGQSFGADGAVADADLVDDYSYWHLRVLLKAGLALEGDNWSTGLTVTTPSLGLMGRGDVYDRAYSSNGFDGGQPGGEPYLQVDTQDGLDADWRSPFSVAVGAARRIGAGRVYVTAEWFDAVGRYDVMAPDPYEIQAVPGVTDVVDLSYAADRVFNWGVGIERIFSDEVSVYASYRVDASTNPGDLGTNLNLSSWDLRHASGGASFILLGLELTAGLQYSWGEAAFVEGLDPTPLDPLLDDPDIDRGTLRFRRLKALLGLNLPFGAPES